MITDRIKTFIEKLENVQMSFWQGVFLLYGIIFVRTFLENWSNYNNFYHMSSLVDIFFHYPSFFLIIFLAIFAIAKILTKEKIEKVAKVITLCSFVILIPPIIDLIINKGSPVLYNFLSGNYSELFNYFITYIKNGTLGIRTEGIVVLSGFGLYIFSKTQSIKKVLLGIFLLYSIVFLAGSTPGIVFNLQNKITHEYTTTEKNTALDFYLNKEPANSITSNRTFVTDLVTDKDFYNQSFQKKLNQYSITLSIIFLIILVILLGWCLFLYSQKKFFIILRNFRHTRIIHYCLLLSVGIYFGVKFLGINPIGSLFDLVSFISAYLALLFAWLFAVWENDEADIEIDKVSNKDRPLAQISSEISISEWHILKYIFLIFSLSFAFLCGLYSFIFVLLSIFIAHIYSNSPLRLKRFLGISSLLIAVEALLAVWLGFFISAGTENFIFFPIKYMLGILGIFFLVENVKNIKDIEGDRKEGMQTIPVIFGEKKGKLIIGICLFLAAILVPFIFYLSILTFILAIIFGLILFYLVNKKDFKENYIFITYFIYVILFLFLSNL